VQVQETQLTKTCTSIRKAQNLLRAHAQDGEVEINAHLGSIKNLGINGRNVELLCDIARETIFECKSGWVGPDLKDCKEEKDKQRTGDRQKGAHHCQR